MAKYVYMFAEGKESMRDILGGKGANLAEMTNLGLPVPPGFTVTSEACTLFNTSGHVLSEEIKEQVDIAMSRLEEQTDKKFGCGENPLLVSVRSGARVSMPGMMDTVLNLGINDVAVKAIAENTDNPRLAYDSYRRFVMMYGNVVKGMDMDVFDDALDEMKEKKGYKSDVELTAEDFEKLTEQFKEIYETELGEKFPQDAEEQLYGAISAVFLSWDNPRAFKYRQMHNIPYEWGTGVTVQSMVFGNMGNDSGTGVVFTRNPASGEKEIFGEYILNAQGEDVVAGIRTPRPFQEFKESNPELYDEFVEVAGQLEKHYKDMQDIEITIEKGKLYILQTRSGKRTAQSALRIATEMYDEGLVTKEEALMQIDAQGLDQLLHPTFAEESLEKAQEIGRGLPASPGAVSGKVYFTSNTARDAAMAGEDVILVRAETSPDDIEGMHLALGILTARGGMTSHAAVVARGIGRCCVAGCGDLRVNGQEKFLTLGNETVKEGEVISLNGSTGKIYLGELETEEATLTEEFDRLMSWADEKRRMSVRTNADTPADVLKAFEFGAEGVGLVRTEHMFFNEERIIAVRRMILAESSEARQDALDTLLPFQRDDFIGLFETVKDKPMTIRLLDPPLHEFMPTRDDEFEDLAKATGRSVDELKRKATELHEINPMMGHRGCRLSVSFPELAEMQTEAIIGAALQVKKEHGYNVVPEIMVPLIGEQKELEYVKKFITKRADELIKESDQSLAYTVGTMIEIPRACITADKIAVEAEFFSFGTNDLTQLTYGISRDDAGKFLDVYTDNLIYEADPTAILDQEGVGELMQMAVTRARKTNPYIHLGICGEHGGEPSSVKFCDRLGLDYVSCSPFRVPIARLAAAQATIEAEEIEYK